MKSTFITLSDGHSVGQWKSGQDCQDAQGHFHRHGLSVHLHAHGMFYLLLAIYYFFFCKFTLNLIDLSVKMRLYSN
jgi:hypothetical protein